MAHKLAELRTMSDDEIVRLYDETARTTVVSLDFYRQELLRRELERQGTRMEAMTVQIKLMTAKMLWLTVAILVLTVLNVALVAWSLRQPS
jgi:hypothetical protein